VTQKNVVGALTAVCIVVLAWLEAFPGHAQEASRKPSHLHALLALGGGYLSNRTTEPRSGYWYTSNTHRTVGFSGQIELGFRLLPLLSLHGMHFLDVGAPQRDGWSPLYRTGVGGGAALHIARVELALHAGAQLTWYMNHIDDPTVPMGADVGPFVSLRAGYAFLRQGPLAVGAHLVARYHHSTDEYMGGRYDPYGVTLALLLSVAFEGAPLVGR
jgi:hypothetical protein